MAVTQNDGVSRHWDAHLRMRTEHEAMASLDNRFSVGVIGAGFVAQVAHLPAFAAAEDCQLAAIADDRSELLDVVADRFGVANRYTDYREMLAVADLQAVIVAVPRRAQSAVVRHVLQAGQPVLTEKPMAYTSAVARQLVELAAAKQTRLAVGYTRLYDPGVRLFQTLLRREMDSGEMGDLLHVTMTDFCGAYTVPLPFHTRSTERRPFRYPEDPPAPAFLDRALHDAYDYTTNVASHDINLLRTLFGNQLDPVYFRVRLGGAQHAILVTPQVDIALSVGPASLGVWEQRIDVYFRKGCLSLILDSSLAKQSSGVVACRWPGREDRLSPVPGDRYCAFDLQARGFLEALREGTLFAADGEAAARDVETIEDMWRIASIGP
jgi:predicted dehydrogenase